MTDWLPELSDDDLATLVDALEAWEHKDDAGEMMGDIIEQALGHGDPTREAMVRTIRERSLRAMRQAAAVRKERSVLLRAKLITLRERRRVERVTKEA